MKKIQSNLFYIFLLLILFTGCKNEDDEGLSAGKPSMDITVTPQDGLKYGDEIIVSGTLSDERNLGMYQISVTDQEGNVLLEKIQMLLGTSFQVDETITLPMVAHAKDGNLNFHFNLRNSRDGVEEKEFTISNVRVPELQQLYLILENNTVYQMNREGNLFEIETSFPAGARGFFSTTPSLTGLFWGYDGKEITCLAKDPIPVGHDIEAFYKISFNPYTFDLNLGEYAQWTALPSSDCFYILGTISGHWQDGEIRNEMAKMKMQGYQSGEQRYYSWIPPDGDDPETGMWGEIASGEFRFKRGGEEYYLLWDGSAIIEGSSNDVSRSFYTSAGGPLEFRIYFDGDECTGVRLSDTQRSLEFEPAGIKINGIQVTEQIDFAGNTLSLKPGTNYIYESAIVLKQGEAIVSRDMDMSRLMGDTDLFTGIGNTSWSLTGPQGTYTIRIDLFKGSFYACPLDGYPSVIYLNGWSWSKNASSDAVTWDADYELALTNNGNNVYETTLYNWGWGGTFTLSATHPYSETERTHIPVALFDTEYASGTEFTLPSGVGVFRISVDLRDGLTISGSTVGSVNNQVLRLTFEQQ
ncbi:MAG: hypothetical protein LUG98_08050 [Tannerellaceae bacterium]|nr:hypothetical protein [Tannerellaceae bacterium]